MTDTPKLFEKAAANSNSIDNDTPCRVYRDEPIPTIAGRTGNFTPPEYREMRKIAARVAYWETDAELFYKQARFMEDFEDDYDFKGEFSRYFPTYQYMSDPQLRGYFSWRTKVRRGVIEKTQLSFAFVYIYELLNQIGVRTPMEGFSALREFRSAYGEIDDRIIPYLRLWMKDYIVYNNLDKALLEDLPTTELDWAVLALLNYQSHDAGEVFSAMNSLSSYNFANSKFFKLYPEDVQNVIYGVFSGLTDYYDKKRKGGLCEKFFGRMHTNHYSMFKAAVFCRRKEREDSVYEINDIYRYIYKNKSWNCERFFVHKGQIQQIGALLKTVDFLMRRKYGFRPTLKVEQTPKLYQDIIEREIDRCREDARKRAVPEVVIDVSKLENIRHTALETQNKLIVEERDLEIAGQDLGAPPQTPLGTQSPDPGLVSQKIEKTFLFFQAEPEIINGLSNRLTYNSGVRGTGSPAGLGGAQGLAPRLNDIERRFMGCLLYGRSYDELVRSLGVTLSMLIDAVNEKLFDEFGDTVVLYDGQRPQLAEEYIEDLKGIVGNE